MMFQSKAATPTSTPDVTPGPAPENRKSAAPQQSIISSDLIIKGDLICTGDLQIDGRVDGDITCRTLTLGAEPVINSKVTADTVRICGSFSGEVRARKVVLASTAKVKGDIYYETLEIQTGAVFEGYVGRHDAEDAAGQKSVTTLKSA